MVRIDDGGSVVSGRDWWNMAAWAALREKRVTDQRSESGGRGVVASITGRVVVYVGKRQPGITLTFNRVKLGSSRGSGGSFRALSIFNFISPQKSYRGFVAEGFFWRC